MDGVGAGALAPPTGSMRILHQFRRCSVSSRLPALAAAMDVRMSSKAAAMRRAARSASFTHVNPQPLCHRIPRYCRNDAQKGRLWEYASRPISTSPVTAANPGRALGFARLPPGLNCPLKRPPSLLGPGRARAAYGAGRVRGGTWQRQRPKTRHGTPRARVRRGAGSEPAAEPAAAPPDVRKPPAPQRSAAASAAAAGGWTDRPRRLLGRGRRPLAGDRHDRRRGVGRRASAADPVARNPQAPALDQDRRPARPPARHARRHGRRRGAAEGPAALRAAGLRRHRGPPLLFASRRRSDRHRARARRQHPASRRVAGRLDPHPAARQEPVPDPGAHALPQGAGGRRWRSGWSANSARRRSSISISTASISAPAPTASRRRRSAISASRAHEAHGGRSRDARGPGALAVAAGAEPQPGRRREARPGRARRHDGHEVHHRRHGQGRADAAGACDQGRRAPARSAMSPTGSWTCSTT